MNCDESREAISASLDGEDPGLSPDALATHLRDCHPCRLYELEAHDLHRLFRVRPAESVPDLSAAILQADAPASIAATPALSWLRYGLAVVGMTMLVLALPSLVLHDSGSAIHLTRELSAWDLAFAIGLLFASWQPARARGLLPMAAVLAGGQLLSSMIDVFSGRAPAVSEAHHALELAGVVMLWWVCHLTAGRPRRAATTTGRADDFGLHPA
jgi:predicted anti-sigma-YlaC factor YlaD